MRSIPYFFLVLLSFYIVFVACTAPVEQNHILTQLGNQQIYIDTLEKTNLAWAPDSSALAFQTPIGLVTLLKYSLFGELLDTLLTLNLPYFDERLAPVHLSPDGTEALYQSTKRRFTLVNLTTGTSKSFRFADLQFVSPIFWMPNGESLYATTQEGDQLFLSVFDRDMNETQTIRLDSLQYCSQAQLYENNAVLFTGGTTDGGRGVWLKRNGAITKIAVEDAAAMTYLPEQGIILLYQHDAALNLNVFKKYSVAEKSLTILNKDFGAIWGFDRLDRQDKIQFGGTHSALRLGIFTLSIDGDVQQLSNWWPFEETQWTENGQSLVTQKLLDDHFSAIYAYDVMEDRLTGLTDPINPMLNLAPAFTPNSQMIIFSQNGQLVRVPTNGGEITALTPSTTPPQFNPEVSPNGQWVACDDGRDIYIVPIDGGELVKISGSLNMSLSNPTWSHDGNRLACQTETTLEILNFDGQQLSEERSYVGQFDKIEWARVETPPFGAPILFRKGQFGVATINPETGAIIDTFSFRFDLVSFCWAANGRDILYTTPWEIIHTPLLSSLSQ